MQVSHISAVTLAVHDMKRALTFYQKMGLPLSHGNDATTFASFQAGNGFINLLVIPHYMPVFWGRVIVHVDDVDRFYRYMKGQGLSPNEPRNGEWGERYFHITDPDGHELSFAKRLQE